jgi:hypothetical protein
MHNNLSTIYCIIHKDYSQQILIIISCIQIILEKNSCKPFIFKGLATYNFLFCHFGSKLTLAVPFFRLTTLQKFTRHIALLRFSASSDNKSSTAICKLYSQTVP